MNREYCPEWFKVDILHKSDEDYDSQKIKKTLTTHITLFTWRGPWPILDPTSGVCVDPSGLTWHWPGLADCVSVQTPHQRLAQASHGHQTEPNVL